MSVSSIVSYHIFKFINQNIAHWKFIYDNYGVATLRTGVKDEDGICRGGYVYQQNCYTIFDNYFLRNNPFFEICDSMGTEVEGSLFGSAFGGMNEPKLPPMPSVEVVVPTTLKEFYNGCIKTVHYERQIVALDGKSVSQQVVNRQVEVKQGMNMECNYSYRNEGHQQPGRIASNLFINFVDAPHDPRTHDFKVTSRYYRSKNNLFYRKLITL